MEELKNINLNDLQESPWQGRFLGFGEIKSNLILKNITLLAENIKQSGLLNPVIVREKDGKYEIIDGHRRVEACRILKNPEIKAIIKNVSDADSQALSVIANLQREDLNAIEKAMAFKKIMDSGIIKDKRALSKKIGKDETYVGDVLNTLKMDSRIVNDLLENKTTDDVRLLRSIRKADPNTIDGKSEKQWQIYQEFKTENLSRKDVYKLVQKDREEKTDKFNVTVTPRKFEIQFIKKAPLKYRNELNSRLIGEIEKFLREIGE